MPESKVMNLGLGGLIEFDSKNDIVLGPDTGDSRAAVQRCSTYVQPLGGLSIQQVSS
jgi:hypothetical protein